MELGTGEWIWIVGFTATIVTLALGFWAVVSNSNSRESALRFEMQEMRTELQSEMRELRTELQSDIRDTRNTLGSRLSDVEREQARLEGVNSVLRDVTLGTASND